MRAKVRPTRLARRGLLVHEVQKRNHDLAEKMFVREWLVYRDDPRAGAQLEAYAEAELAAGEVMLRFDRLAKLSKLQPNWTFYSPGFERSVLRHLAKRWPLEYCVELAEIA